jgi:hypothetical protein
MEAVSMHPPGVRTTMTTTTTTMDQGSQTVLPPVPAPAADPEFERLTRVEFSTVFVFLVVVWMIVKALHPVLSLVGLFLAVQWVVGPYQPHIRERGLLVRITTEFIEAYRVTTPRV